MRLYLILWCVLAMAAMAAPHVVAASMPHDGDALESVKSL